MSWGDRMVRSWLESCRGRGMALGLASSMVNVAVPSVIGAYGIGLDQA